MAKITKTATNEVATPEIDTDIAVEEVKSATDTKAKTMVCIINCLANGKKFTIGKTYSVADIGDAVKFGAFV